MQHEHTTLTLENENGVYTISLRSTTLPLDVVVDELVEPLLLAAGYSQGAINRCLRGEGGEVDCS